MFRSILVPIDLGHERASSPALAMAAELARPHGAEVHIVNVVPPMGFPVVGSFFPPDYEQKAIEEAKSKLAEFASKHSPEGLAPKLHVAHGTIYEEIIRAADTLGVDLIVMTAHRPELKDYLIGPNAARVVRHARQSVFVVRE